MLSAKEGKLLHAKLPLKTAQFQSTLVTTQVFFVTPRFQNVLAAIGIFSPALPPPHMANYVVTV